VCPRSPTAPRDAVRQLLARYLAARCSGPGRRLEGGDAAAAPLPLLLVDAFAGAAHDEPEGRPLPLGTLVPGAGAGRAVRVLLLDEDPVRVEWLRQVAGEAPGGGPAGGAGEIAVAEGALPELAAMLPAADAAESVVLLDAPSARALPLDAVLALARDGGAELIVRLPVAELRRLERFRALPLADLPPYARRIVDGWSGMAGARRHEWFLGWHGALRGGEDAAERTVADAYAAALRERLRGRVVRRVEVGRGDGEPPDHLVHVASSGEQPLTMNRVLHGLRGGGVLPWPAAGDGLVRYQDPGLLELFAGASGAPPGGAARIRAVDTPALAQRLALEHAGRTVGYDLVLGGLAESELFVEDVRAALLALRREGRARFRTPLHPATEVAFAEAGSAVAPGAGRRLREARGGQPALFDPPEG
jgi:hypothetical protein